MSLFFFLLCLQPFLFKYYRTIVIISSIKINEYRIDTNFKVSATIKNIGKTAAFNSKGIIKFAYATYEKDLEFVFKGYMDSGVSKTSATVIGAGRSIDVDDSDNKFLTRSRDIGFKSNKLGLYFIMKVTYDDIYKHNHFIHTFVKYDIINHGYSVCKTYNDAN